MLGDVAERHVGHVAAAEGEASQVLESAGFVDEPGPGVARGAQDFTEVRVVQS